MTAKKVQRAVLRTILLVGEGYAEVAFLQHLKSLYVSRGCGLALTIKNAGGKGALNVVNVARRHSLNADYDVKAALFDADTDWNDKTQAVARKEKVQVIACNPCLEAMLLALHGDKVLSRTTEQCKQVFTARFGAKAHDVSLYAKHFSFEFLEKARVDSPVLEALLGLLKPAKS